MTSPFTTYLHIQLLFIVQAGLIKSSGPPKCSVFKISDIVSAKTANKRLELGLVIFGNINFVTIFQIAPDVYAVTVMR